jgi:hypothetical protein
VQAYQKGRGRRHHIGRVQSGMRKQATASPPFMANFMLDVPLASIPAVEMCLYEWNG